jgi:hypothetical protein
VNALLQDFLAQITDRDADETRNRVGEVAEALGEATQIETLLFGGSVAKHTYVDGLSDVDALVVLDREGTRGLSPQQVLDKFQAELRDKISAKEVESVDRGDLAVTVRYRDGTELQLLPAVRSGSKIAIPDSSGTGWNQTNPKRFQRELSRQNERLNNALVPTIKLIKSLVGDLPAQQRLSGYHTEAVCLDAARSFRGPKTPRALLIHVLDHAAQRVRRPIRDVTGQSRNVDGYLGSANSARRRLVSQALASLGRRLEAATSINQWRAMFGRSEK